MRFFHSLMQFTYSWTENADIFEKAIQDTKRWFQEKKEGLSSVTELPQGSSNLKPTTVKDVGDSSPSSYCFC